MPRTAQIIPEHKFPSRTVVVNDNSEVSETPAADSGDTKLLCVFSSPKGKDREMQTIDGGLAQWVSEYGQGPFSLYGQPYLNAYAAVSTGNATLQCIRVTAPDAAYSNATLVAKAKVTELTPAGEGTPATKNMTVKFEVKQGTQALVDLDGLADSYPVADAPDSEGFTEIKLFSLAYKGRGKYGNNIRWRLTSNSGTDKENSYKNYFLEIYENLNALTKQETFSVIFNDEAIINGMNFDADAVLNDPDHGSQYVVFQEYIEGFQALYDMYKTAVPDTDLLVEDFDPLLGINKYAKGTSSTAKTIPHYSIDTIGGVALNDLKALPILNGSDGQLDPSTPEDTRKTVLDAAYLKAFSGEYDPHIKSKNRFPVNIILDANYGIEIKKAIAALTTQRKDCVGFLDITTTVNTKEGVAEWVNGNIDSYVMERIHSIEGYSEKVIDPYSKKIVTVTGTYYLAAAYPNQFAANGGKHVPLSGNRYGVMSGFIKNSVYPVFDEDIDADLMDNLVDNRINFVKLNAKGKYVRATQTTRQDKLSNLSELNNVFLLLDVNRDCEILTTMYEYNFSEASDIARFNEDVKLVTAKYEGTQLRAIQASFGKNSWEAERGILHLYVSMVHKDLVKNVIIEVDVNR